MRHAIDGIGSDVNTFSMRFLCLASCRQIDRYASKHEIWKIFLVSKVILALLNFQAPSAWADGFRNPFQDSAALGQGTAFIAQADNPSAIHFNPAAMTQLSGIQHSVGVQFLNPSTKFTSTNGQKVENDLNGPVGLPPPGQFFLTVSFQDYDIGWLKNFTLGLGLESLYGFASEWPKDGPFATALTRAQLPLLDIKPSVAYKLSDWLSVGVGADFFTFAPFVGEGHFEQQSIAIGNIPGTTAGELVELNGKGTTAGLNASFLLTLLRNEAQQPLLTLGFIWRSQAVLPINGRLLANGQHVADISSSLRFPEIYEGGVAIWPLRNQEKEWKVEVDVHYVRWQSIRSGDITLSSGMAIPQPQKWNNALTVLTGTEWTWLSPDVLPDWEVALRTGYIYSESATTDISFNPSFPDSDLHVVSVGVGFTCKEAGKFFGVLDCTDSGSGWFTKKAIVLDLGVQTIFYETRNVTGSPVSAFNGTYKSRATGGSLTVQVNF
ncbi:MAG: outer membrane protein transport protein [Nitrospira sp.]|nr:outer membrane protein transport protein [Nitrospira sp.]